MKTDNELIAEFMGKQITAVTANFGERVKVLVLPDKPLSERRTGKSIEAKYDTSWDWLMPVVEKISKLDLGPIENENASQKEIEEATKQAEVCMLCIDTPIDFVHQAVVEFIKWYNNESTKRS